MALNHSIVRCREPTTPNDAYRPLGELYFDFLRDDNVSTVKDKFYVSEGSMLSGCDRDHVTASSQSRWVASQL